MRNWNVKIKMKIAPSPVMQELEKGFEGGFFFALDNGYV
jgi:hypothetical protein